MGIGSTIVKSIIGGSAKSTYAREAIDAGKTIALKLSGKAAFQIRKLMGGNFGKTDGRPIFHNLKSGTDIVYSSSTHTKDGRKVYDMFVKFGDNNKAAKRMGLGGLTKTYDAKTGKYLETEYVFNAGTEINWLNRETERYTFYNKKASEVRPMLSIINHASKVLPESVKSSKLGELIKTLLS